MRNQGQIWLKRKRKSKVKLTRSSRLFLISLVVQEPKKQKRQKINLLKTKPNDKRKSQLTTKSESEKRK